MRRSGVGGHAAARPGTAEAVVSGRGRDNGTAGTTGTGGRRRAARGRPAPRGRPARRAVADDGRGRDDGARRAAAARRASAGTTADGGHGGRRRHDGRGRHDGHGGPRRHDGHGRPGRHDGHGRSRRHDGDGWAVAARRARRPRRHDGDGRPRRHDGHRRHDRRRGTGPVRGHVQRPDRRVAPNANSGDLGTAATCHEVDRPHRVRWSAATSSTPRTFTVNGTTFDCVAGSGGHVFPRRATAASASKRAPGNNAYAYFATYRDSVTGLREPRRSCSG